MKEFILIVAVFGFFAFGYFLMHKLDAFFNEHKKKTEIYDEQKQPSLVMLTDQLSDEEVIEEVKRFRKTHKNSKIMLCDSTYLQTETDTEDEIPQ